MWATVMAFIYFFKKIYLFEREREREKEREHESREVRGINRPLAEEGA